MFCYWHLPRDPAIDFPIRINNYTFDMDRMTSFEGDTGPYLQYSHARLCSIIRKVGLPAQKLEEADLSLLQEKHAIDILVKLAHWPEIFQTAYKTLEPVTVLTYLWKLTHAINSSYDHLNVINSEPEVKLARLTLYSCSREVLASAMKLLGLTPVTRQEHDTPTSHYVVCANVATGCKGTYAESRKFSIL
jgi:arginyl-tRNA synthetase